MVRAVETVTWADAVEAVASAVGAVLTAAALFFAVATLRREQDADRERRETAQRALAAEVVAWPSRPTGRLGQFDAITVKNGSGLPITNVSLFRPAGRFDPQVVLADWRVLAPGELIEVVLGPEDVIRHGAGRVAPYDYVLVFTDAAGVTWARTTGGRLERHTWVYTGDLGAPQPRARRSR